MGTGYFCKCDKCGYEINARLGVGFMFQKLYKEVIQKMKSGDLGEQGKKFFENHPDGAVSCERVVAMCSVCGECGTVPDRYGNCLWKIRSEARK